MTEPMSSREAGRTFIWESIAADYQNEETVSLWREEFYVRFQ
jgi:hypothetical protein